MSLYQSITQFCAFPFSARSINELKKGFLYTEGKNGYAYGARDKKMNK